MLCDIDYFKAYNDTYGHQAGDDCLKQVAGALQASLRRPADLAARYGGEEFVLVLPNSGRQGARHIALTIRERVLAMQIPHEKSGAGVHLTLSMGITDIVPAQGASVENFILRADQALYAAKNRGRNRVEVAGPS